MPSAASLRSTVGDEEARYRDELNNIFMICPCSMLLMSMMVGVCLGRWIFGGKKHKSKEVRTCDAATMTILVNPVWYHPDQPMPRPPSPPRRPPDMPVVQRAPLHPDKIWTTQTGERYREQATCGSIRGHRGVKVLTPRHLCIKV